MLTQALSRELTKLTGFLIMFKSRSQLHSLAHGCRHLLRYLSDDDTAAMTSYGSTSYGSPYMPAYGYPGLPPPPGAGYGSSLWPYHSNATVVDVVPLDMRYMIHDHWYDSLTGIEAVELSRLWVSTLKRCATPFSSRYHHSPMNPLWHSLLGVTMVVLGIISVVGNGVVLYLMLTVKSLRTPNVSICLDKAVGQIDYRLTSLRIEPSRVELGVFR